MSISQWAVTVTADSGQAKIYGTPDPTLTYTVTSGSLQPGDSFSGALARTAGENVGITAINQGTLTAGPNYTITFVPANFTIVARAITVTAATTPRSTTPPPLLRVCPPSPPAPSPAPTPASFTQTFDTKNVGTAKTLTPAGTVTDGNGGANYAITFATNTTGVITAASVTGLPTAANKVYNGTTAAVVSGGTLTGVIAPDVVTLNVAGATGVFTPDANVGNGKTVNVTGLALSGAQAGNYQLTSTSATTTANITPATTTIAIGTHSPNPSNVGQAYTVTWSISVTAPGAGTPTGTVTVTDGLDTCNAAVGAGQCTLTSTTAGAKTLIATYAGDTNFTTSTSPGVSHTVNCGGWHAADRGCHGEPRRHGSPDHRQPSAPPEPAAGSSPSCAWTVPPQRQLADHHRLGRRTHLVARATHQRPLRHLRSVGRVRSGDPHQRHRHRHPARRRIPTGLHRGRLCQLGRARSVRLQQRRHRRTDRLADHHPGQLAGLRRRQRLGPGRQPHTVPANQTMVNQVLDSVGDTFWTQRLTNAVASPGAVTINNAAPTNDQWNYAAVEILSGTTVTLAPTSTGLVRSAGPNPSIPGESVSFTATVTSGSGTPTGTVQFKDGVTNLGAPRHAHRRPGHLRHHHARLSAHTPSPASTRVTRASPPARPAAVAHQVTQAATATALVRSAGPNPSTVGQSVSFTATVTSGSGTPSGTVQFRDGVTNLGAPVALTAGQATFTTTTLGCRRTLHHRRLLR